MKTKVYILLALVAVGGGLFWYFDQRKKKKKIKEAEISVAESVEAQAKGQSFAITKKVDTRNMTTFASRGIGAMR